MVQVGQKAPDFEATAVVDQEFKKIKLSDYKGKNVVLFFYPLDFTFVCPTEIIAFDRKVAEFQDRDTQLIGVSIDSEYVHLAWMNTPITEGGIGPLRYPLVADVTKNVARAYGVLLEDKGVALRGTFLIDKEGVVRHVTVNDLPLGRNVDETLRMIDALAYHEEHGEVCPANWNKGDRAIDKKRAKEYFQTVTA
ncbi:MAG: peroxiredoxin [Euryarchaeota archaeon]|nr:peroxiredoxin [Euryarchaeota archaeon]